MSAARDHLTLLVGLLERRAYWREALEFALRFGNESAAERASTMVERFGRCIQQSNESETARLINRKVA